MYFGEEGRGVGRFGTYDMDNKTQHHAFSIIYILTVKLKYFEAIKWYFATGTMGSLNMTKMKLMVVTQHPKT